MIQPPNLKAGDKIGIISTARKISIEEIQPAIDKLAQWDLEVELGQNLFEKHHQFAGTDQQRAHDLQQMINNPEIKAILCARGGYGTVRIIDQIDFSPLLTHPKWIIGYSDITVLHSHLHQLGLATIHAIMPINFPSDLKDNHSILSLHQALFTGKLRYSICDNYIENDFNIEGELVGGNLSILYSLMGSQSQIITKSKILFIEDLDEYLYHIDRMMMNLKRSETLKDLKGLIVGGMSDMNDNQVPFGFTPKEIIRTACQEYRFPILFDFPAGHQPDNRAMIFGKECRIFVENNQLIFAQE